MKKLLSVLLSSLLLSAYAFAQEKDNERLTPEMRVQIIYKLSAEYARAIKPLPYDKKGFRIEIQKGLDENALRQSIAKYNASILTGDQVQITHIEFQEKQIIIELNGGSRPKKKKWYERIQIGVGQTGDVGPIGRPPQDPQQQPQKQDPSAPPGQNMGPMGCTLILDFGKSVPNVTPEQIKEYLKDILDFSEQRSPTEQWIESLPPEIQQAIKDKKAIVGMTKEHVVAAIGPPDRKVKETKNGVEVEEWIYGYPPAKVTFVVFHLDDSGESKVVEIKEFF